MTSPFANPPSIPAAPQAQIISGGGIQDYLPLILQALQASAARKQRKAETAVGTFEEGLTVDKASPDQLKAYKRATGIDPKTLAVGTPLRPLPASDPGQVLKRSMDAAGIPDTSALGISLLYGQAAQAGTGSAQPLNTPAGFAAAAQTGEATSKTGLSLAEARKTQAQDYQRATTKVSNLPAGQNIEEAKLTPGELTSYQTFSNFVPSEPVAAQLTGQTKAAVMKSALQLAANPNSASWAGLFPGIKPADIIGAWALGVGSTLDIGLSRKAELEITTAKEAIRSLMDAAQEKIKDTKLPYSPAMVAAVMEGNPGALKSGAGQVIWHTMNAGWQAAIAEQAQKGNPRMIAVKGLMDLARIPQIAGNEKLLDQYSNLIQENLASALNESFGIEDNPANHNEMRKRTAGVFDYDWRRNFVPGRSSTEIRPANQPTPDERKRQMDAATWDQVLDALTGAQSTKKPGSLFQTPR